MKFDTGGPDNERIESVETIARVGSETAHEWFRSGVTAETKGDTNRVVDPGDVVTVADREAQQACLSAIDDVFPDDTVVAEEADAPKELPGSGDVWVIDPIDGTYNFVRGLPTWATAVAVVEDGETTAAATDAPALGERYAAGESVTLNGTTVEVSERETPETFAVAYSVVPDYGNRASYAAGVANLIERFGTTRRVGSLQVVLGRVAAGTIEGAVTPRTPNPWDSVAGVHMVRAAGGVVTDIHGRDWHPDSEGLVASNGTAHDQLLAATQHMAEKQDAGE